MAFKNTAIGLAVWMAIEACSGVAWAEPLQEKSCQYTFPDGVGLRVHYSEESLAAVGESTRFAREVLDAAVSAYQTITEFKGFSTAGYSFASPDKRYAYDGDRVIDIYLGEPAHKPQSWKDLSSKDAPCFDTIRVSDTQYEAVILLPADYRRFIKGWEKINPSPLGVRNVEVDLRGTLIHEMLHTLLFYYNKNLSREAAGEKAGRDKKMDWYIEGLARYFETFAGARHDFYSQGFKETLPDKVRFSRGGSNYFMRYPDQAFTDLRYENAVFWRFIDQRYGISTIEAMSRRFRSGAVSPRDVLERATKTRFEDLLMSYASAILFKEFGLKEDTGYLLDVARTRLTYRDGALWLLYAGGSEKLGPVCRTDWVGEWEGQGAVPGQNPIAGDATPQADVSAWATDYIEIRFESASLPWLGVKHVSGGGPLGVQLYLRTKGGSVIRHALTPIRRGAQNGVALERLLAREGLAPADLEAIVVLVTNEDAASPAEYEILTRA